MTVTSKQHAQRGRGVSLASPRLQYPPKVYSQVYFKKKDWLGTGVGPGRGSHGRSLRCCWRCPALMYRGCLFLVSPCHRTRAACFVARPAIICCAGHAALTATEAGALSRRCGGRCRHVRAAGAGRTARSQTAQAQVCRLQHAAPAPPAPARPRPRLPRPPGHAAVRGKPAPRLHSGLSAKRGPHTLTWLCNRRPLINSCARPPLAGTTQQGTCETKPSLWQHAPCPT